ncbi:uncharacterized protein LOC119594706 [Penaeus monodon]|uniref:uncharacterized protein LOC119594706 n=1 Tax=Penaeus monodon TaxID=6687 RepID=UPI0018A76921|nr:uncharacterized protein LOC119594706 [Penaeus monodon]
MEVYKARHQSRGIIVGFEAWHCRSKFLGMYSIAKFVFLWWAVVGLVSAHGYMSSPAARNSAWRVGFDVAADYNDNELSCGGRGVQHWQNGGRCGVCGDDWRLPEPRPHERGGRFGRGVVTANYSEGQVVPVTIHISANHKGWYEFRLCSNSDAGARDSQRCLDKHLLAMADGSGSRYALDASVRGDHIVHVQLPRGVSCAHCVLQWTWTVGNSWGTCPDGGEGLGCGPQETFVNCADVSIHPKGFRPASRVSPKFRKPWRRSA